MEIMQLICLGTIIFTSCTWFVASLMCLKCYRSLAIMYSKFNDELREITLKVAQVESHNKGLQKTIMNHNDRIDSLTTKVVRILNTKELQNDQSN